MLLKEVFKLSNHLGNVLVTVSDKKVDVPSAANSSLTSHHEADVMSAQDYYPFRMLMNGRGGSVSNDGGWSSGSSSLPQSLSISSRSGNEPAEYCGHCL